MRVRLLLLPVIALALPLQAESPLFRFGVVADAQYADQDAAGPRRYRESLGKLKACADSLTPAHPAFVVQLGDLVDGGAANFDRILPVWDQMPAPRYHVLGNHDIVLPLDALVRKLGMPSAYYDFTAQGWRFVVLDGMSVNASNGGAAMLDSLQQQKAPNAQAWNGAVGTEQRQWLDRTLADAARRKQRAIVFCHFPTLPAACRREHLLWDYQEVLGVLDRHPAVAAWMNGHDHRGGYALDKGIHHLTFSGMVEGAAASTCRVVDVYQHRLVVRKAGENPVASGVQALILRD
jgi:manganese-dependent ADP-ribose/CDP-alcohol diphosphatase